MVERFSGGGRFSGGQAEIGNSSVVFFIPKKRARWVPQVKIVLDPKTRFSRFLLRKISKIHHDRHWWQLGEGIASTQEGMRNGITTINHPRNGFL